MQTTAQNTVARTGLRPLSPAEEGTGFQSLPAGVFGFTYAPLSESPLFSRQSYHAFEMQKLPDGSGALIAFVNSEEAKAIRAADRDLDVGLYPDKWGTATEAISIPIDRLQRRNRNPIREEGARLDVIVYSARTVGSSAAGTRNPT